MTMSINETRVNIRRYLNQLAPHIREREAAELLNVALAALDDVPHLLAVERQTEREECAKVCDGEQMRRAIGGGYSEICANAIRMRSNVQIEGQAAVGLSLSNAGFDHTTTE
jgi:hypothetical protein